MQVEVLQKLLNKSQQLLQSNTGETLSTIEKDLLKDYLRKAYDLLSDSEGKPQVQTQVVKPNETIQSPPKQPESLPYRYTNPAVIIEDAPPPVESKPTSEPAFVPKQHIPTPIIDTDKDKKRTIVDAALKPDKKSPLIIHDDDLDNSPYVDLFEYKKTSDLADKLESLPISDIKKAMGLNERISTQNELFDNNAAAFESTLQYLNNCENFGNAKSYLCNDVIPKFKWTAENKKAKALHFIKLVRRRYQ